MTLGNGQGPLDTFVTPPEEAGSPNYSPESVDNILEGNRERTDPLNTSMSPAPGESPPVYGPELPPNFNIENAAAPEAGSAPVYGPPVPPDFQREAEAAPAPESDILQELEAEVRAEVVAKDRSVELAIEALEIKLRTEGQSVVQPDGSVVLEKRAITGRDMVTLIREGTQDKDGQAAGDEYDDLKKYIEEQQELGRLDEAAQKVWEAYAKRIEAQRQLDPENKGIEVARHEEILGCLDQVAEGKEDPGLGMPPEPFKAQEVAIDLVAAMKDPSANQNELMAILDKLTREEMAQVLGECRSMFEDRDIQGELTKMALEALERDENTDLAKSIIDKMSDEQMLAISEELKRVLDTEEEVDKILIARAVGEEAMHRAEEIDERLEAIEEAETEEAKAEAVDALQKYLAELDAGDRAEAKVAFKMMKFDGEAPDLDQRVLDLNIPAAQEREILANLNEDAMKSVFQRTARIAELVAQTEIDSKKAV
ncbi:MAG: hypothetical protein KDD70_08695 [Bdellovibrionales bacterium]|nr:hypothetical protein [Bdellovibrionales bacterium]